MQSIRRILLSAPDKTDLDAALRRTVELARRNKAHLTLVDTVPFIAPDLWLTEAQITPSELQGKLIEQRRAALEQCAARLRAKIEVEVKVLVGTPFLETIREVLRGGYDLLIKPAEGEGGGRRRLFGSTDMHLLRKCPCPLWLVKPVRHTRLRHIVAAVDIVENDEDDAMNHRILSYAVGIARAEKAELHVLHVWNFLGDSLLRGLGGMSEAQLQVLRDEIRQRHQRWLRALVAGYGELLPQCHPRLEEGSPAQVIPALAKQVGARLIVMGTVGRSGIPGLLMGNTAERVLNQVDCSVLAIKPERFHTPVRVD